MIKTSSVCARSLVRPLCRCLVLAALSFCLSHNGFGGVVKVFYFSSVGNTLSSSSVGNVSPGDFVTPFLNNKFGFVVNRIPRYLVSPSLGASTVTNRYADIDHPISFDDVPSPNPFTVWSSISASPGLQTLFSFAVSVSDSGYNGPGLEYLGQSSGKGYYNFDFRTVSGEILCSTNIVLRNLLLSYLSNIQFSVRNIDVNVSGLQSSVDVGNDRLSAISNALFEVGSNVSGVHSNSALSVHFLSDLRELYTAINSPVVDFPRWLSFLEENGIVTSGSADSWLLTYNSFSDPTSRVSFVEAVRNEVNNMGFVDTFLRRLNSNPSALIEAGSSLNESVVDALIGDYPVDDVDSKRAVKSVNTRTSIKAQLQSWRNDVKQQLNDWKTDLKADLQAWKTSDETGYLNIKNSIDGNFSYTQRGSTNQLPFTSYVTNFVTRIVTNSIEQSSADVQSNATSNADRQIKDSQDRWEEFKRYTLGDGEGLNVKIKWPLVGDLYSVNVRDADVLAAIENLHAMPVELTAIKDNIQWFREGGSMNVNLPTNLVDMLYEILDAITNRPSNSYLLLDDYAFYISNGVYQTSIEQLANDFPNVYTNLQKYGLTSSGNGNFWSLFGANLIYQSGLIGSLLEDMATIRKFADDHIEGGFAGGISSIVSKFPSATQLEDQINNSTSQVFQINLATTNFVFSFESVTNIAPSVFKPFADSFDSPPSGDIVFFKTANDKYVSIPVHEQASVWSLIRSGIAFALVGVQFLLFPKFVLAVVVLFSRLSNRFIKFVPTDR